MEGSLRTPALVRYPGRVPAGQESNEIVHITDMFTTLSSFGPGWKFQRTAWIDGVDQRAFFRTGNKQAQIVKASCIGWVTRSMESKWRNFKMVLVERRH